MVGSTTTGGLREDALQGDVELLWRVDREIAPNLPGAAPIGNYRLYATFSDIVNLDQNKAHITESFEIEAFGGSTGNFIESSRNPGRVRLEGAFYGPGHAEAAGIVEYPGLIGAFGARKVE